MADLPLDTSPPDFKGTFAFGRRRSALIMPDHLLILSHGYLKDRLERVGYDRMDYTVMQRKFPLGLLVGWSTVWALLAVIPLMIGFNAGGHDRAPAFTVAAGALIPIGICAVRSLIMRSVELTLVRGGSPRTFKLYCSKKKAAAGYDKLTAAIHAEQARLAAQGA